MKRIRIKGFAQNPDETPEQKQEQDFFELLTAKKVAQAKKIISAGYSPNDSPSGCEFRTTMELQHEFGEMVSLSESAVNDAMNDLGFEIICLDNKPNRVLHPNRTDRED